MYVTISDQLIMPCLRVIVLVVVTKAIHVPIRDRLADEIKQLLKIFCENARHISITVLMFVYKPTLALYIP